MRPVPSLRPLFPSSSISLEAAVEGPIPEGALESWMRDLRSRLASEELLVTPAGTPGAVPVAIGLTLEVDEGWTEAGTRFFGGRARAFLRVGRRSHEFQGRAFAGTDRSDLARRALHDLLDRVTVALGF